MYVCGLFAACVLTLSKGRLQGQAPGRKTRMTRIIKTNGGQGDGWDATPTWQGRWGRKKATSVIAMATHRSMNELPSTRKPTAKQSARNGLAAEYYSRSNPDCTLTQNPCQRSTDAVSSTSARNTRRRKAQHFTETPVSKTDEHHYENGTLLRGPTESRVAVRHYLHSERRTKGALNEYQGALTNPWVHCL